MASGRRAARCAFFSSGGTNIGTASLLPDAAGRKESVDIGIVPLATALRDRGIDIEGYEDRALMPLLVRDHQALWPRAVLIETVLKRHWAEDCLARLEALDYRVAGDTGENVLFLHPMTEKLES